jgi:hypothetical protein
MRDPERLERRPPEARLPDKRDTAPRLHDAGAAPADIGDMVQWLERLFADAIAYLRGLSASPDPGREATSREPLLRMLGQQQVLVEALEQEIAQGHTGGLSGGELEAIVDGLQAQNEQCRRLLAAHVEALERRLAVAQRQENRSRRYRAHQSGVGDMRGPGR